MASSVYFVPRRLMRGGEKKILTFEVLIQIFKIPTWVRYYSRGEAIGMKKTDKAS